MPQFLLAPATDAEFIPFICSPTQRKHIYCYPPHHFGQRARRARTNRFVLGVHIGNHLFAVTLLRNLIKYVMDQHEKNADHSGSDDDEDDDLFSHVLCFLFLPFNPIVTSPNTRALVVESVI